MYRPSESALRRIVHQAMADALTAGQGLAEGREAAANAVLEAHCWQIGLSEAEAIVRRLAEDGADSDDGNDDD